jgi:hypothetical protein
MPVHSSRRSRRLVRSNRRSRIRLRRSILRNRYDFRSRSYAGRSNQNRISRRCSPEPAKV